MKYSHTICSCTVLSFVFIIGCTTNPTGVNNSRETPSLVTPYEEASAEQIAKEITELCLAFDISSGGLQKTATVSTSGPELSMSGQAWSYANGWWVRKGEFSLTGTQDEALTLSGYDSAQFKNAEGTTIHYPIAEHATSASLIHQGTVQILNRRGGYINVISTYTLNGELSNSTTDTTLTLKGTLAQHFKAESADKSAKCDYRGTAEVNAVTCLKTLDGWSKPTSGTIYVSSPYRDIAIVFSNGTAEITVSNKDGLVRLTTSVTL